jgi:PAS domain S-box-containing protein
MNKAVKQYLQLSGDPQLLIERGSLIIIENNAAAKAWLNTRKIDKDFCPWLESQGIGRKKFEENCNSKNLHKLPSGVLIRTEILDQKQLLLSVIEDENISSPNNSGIYLKNIAAIYRSSAAGKMISCNQAFADILGYTIEETLNKEADELYLDPLERKKFIRKLEKEKKVFNYAGKYLRANNEVAWCYENAYIEEFLGEDCITGTLVDISDRERSNVKFESLFQNATDAIFIVEKNKIVEANIRAKEIFGYNQNELKNLALWDQKKGLFRHTGALSELLEHKLKKVNTNEQQRIQIISKRKNGSFFHSEVHLIPFELQHNTYTQLIVRDISERVLYESAIRESEERFKLLSDVAIEGVVFVEGQNVIDCNEQFAKLFGYRKSGELVGKKVTDFISETDLKRLENVLELKSLNKVELRSQSRDGQVLFLEAAGSWIQRHERGLKVFLCYDITSRKRTEQALEQSTERFKNLVENSPNAIFILTDGTIKYINQSGLSLLGFEDEDDVFDEDFSDYFAPEDRPTIIKDLENIRQGDDVGYRELKMLDSRSSGIDVGINSTLTVYDNRPSIQVTINNLSTQMMLVQEQMRAQIAEEINIVLKEEIEEHKKTQSKLIAAQNFTRNIIESSIDMIIAVDQEGFITEFNTAAQRQFGYGLIEVLGQNAQILYNNQEQLNQISETIEKNQYFSGEIQNVDKQGKEFTALLSASIIKDQHGNVLGSMGVSRDITELKKAQEELQRSEDRYRDIFENATDFILSIDQDGYFIYSNNAFKNTMGYTATELSNIRIPEVVADKHITKRTSIFKTFVSDNLEACFVAKDGSRILVQGTSSVRELNGKPHSIRAILRDVTIQKEHEKKALEQKAKLESVFNSTENMMMWTLDSKFNLTSFNNNFQKCLLEDYGLQLSLEDPYLKNITPFVDKNKDQGYMKAFKEAFLGKPQQFELPLFTVEDEMVWHQVFLNPVYYGDTMEEISCLAYDITDRKQIDTRIRTSLREKEVLLQEVHHRVKNNLQVISSILNLQSSFVTDEKTLQILAESQSRIKTMSYIHETLYQTSDFSSIEFTDYINTLARNLIQSYSSGSTEISLKTDFDQIYLNLDQAIPCGLIINELVSNATKYAFKDKPKGVILLRIKEKDNKIELEVSDNGIGLTDDFDPENSDSLGIYLVQALVEQLDAEMKIVRQPGARFLITFDKQ